MSRARPGRPAVPPRVPRPLHLVAWVVITLGVAMSFVGAWRTGISFDEPYHVLRLQNYLDHGWYLLPDDLDGTDVGAWVGDEHVYAPVTMLLLHGLNVLLGLETPGSVATTPEAYAVRHLGVAAIGLLGLGAAAAMGRMLLRSWRWAVVAASWLVAMPLWTGHSMFNVKDVPVAAGYTLVTAGLMYAVRPGGGRIGTGLVIASVAGGVLLAVGTRPGIWPGLVAAGCAAALLGRWHLTARDRRRAVLAPALGVVLALVLLAVVYPRVFLDPAWPLRSALASSSYREEGGDWTYLPVNLGATLPHVLLLLGTVATCAALLGAARSVAGRPGVQETRLALVLMQCLLLPVLGMLTEASLYNGLRQVLFAAPAAAVLFTWGLHHLLVDVERGARRATAARTVVLVAALAVVLPMVVQARLFPYNYAYFSPLLDSRDLPLRNDFWRTSIRELESQVPRGEFVICSPEMSADGSLRRVAGAAGRSPVDGSRDCRTDWLSPLAPYRREHVPGWEPVADTFIAVSTEPVGSSRNCSRIGEVTRMRHFAAQTMSAVYRCDLVLPPFPAGGLRPDAGGRGAEYLLGGWTGNHAQAGIRLVEPSGSLGFHLPARLAGGPVELALETDAAAAARVRVNNVEVGTVRPGSARGRWTIPRQIAGALGGDRFVVTLQAPAAALTAGPPLRLVAVDLLGVDGQKGRAR